MDIQKEFDRWWNTFKSQATRQYPVKAAREAWAACAKLMADENEKLKDVAFRWQNTAIDLQAESIKWTHTAQYRLSQHLQSKLDEAVEIIKDEICKVWEKGCERRERAEQFLSSLDKPKEDK